MKYIILIALGFLPFCAACAQNVNESQDTLSAYSRKASRSGYKRQLDVFYNWAYPGRNLSLQYVHYFGRHALTGGIKYHINGKEKISPNLFEHMFYANPAIERFGVNIGYQFDLIRAKLPQKNTPRFNPFLHAQIQYGYLGTRHTDYVYDHQGNPLSIETSYRDNFFLFEYTAGVGLTGRIYKKWLLNTGLGFSIIMAKPTFNTMGSIYRWRYMSEGGPVYQLGVSNLLN